MPLGQRPDYGQYRPLAEAVHYDAHLLLHLRTTSFRFDGLGSSWLVQLGRHQARTQLYPRPAIVQEMDRHSWLLKERARVRETMALLREYDPMLHWIVDLLCVGERAAVSFVPGRQLRHVGPEHEAVLRECGSEATLARRWRAGWGLLAVLLVPADVLDLALTYQGAVDQRALRWARETGLV